MYSVANYGAMIEDEVRLVAYEQALKKAVMPGSVVADIGAGTGIATLLACKLGAARIFAIEPNPAIQIARDIVSANGYQDRVVFFSELSPRVILPEKVDVLVSDLRGALPLMGNHIPTIIDARKRFLKPDGLQIPLRDTMIIAGVSAQNIYDKSARPWCANRYGFDMSAGWKLQAHRWTKGRAKPEQIFLPPKTLATLDYTTIETPDIVKNQSWIVEKNEILHGYQIWFDALLQEGVTYSTGPFTPELIYGTPFLPLSSPIPLKQGDLVQVEISAKLAKDDYSWRWLTNVERNGKVVASYDQNTLLGQPLSLEQLKKRSDHYVPKLNEDGKIANLILNMMSSGYRLGDISSAIFEKFPDKFNSWESALSFVGEFVQKYT